MAEDLIGGVHVAEIEAEFLATGLPGGAGSGREVQFLRKLAALVEKRMIAGEVGSGALFLLANGVDECMAGREARPEPLLSNGNYPFSGKIWVLNAGLANAHELATPWTNPASAIAAARNEGLGDLPAAAVDISDSQGTLHMSFFPEGCAVPDSQCDVHLINRPITSKEIKGVLDRFFKDSLRTPMRLREGHGDSVWKEAGKGIPNDRPEEIIEHKLLERLRAAFPTHDSHAQTITPDGYLDIAIYKDDRTMAGHPAKRCDWVLELKALADKTANDNEVSLNRTTRLSKASARFSLTGQPRRASAPRCASTTCVRRLKAMRNVSQLCLRTRTNPKSSSGGGACSAQPRRGGASSFHSRQMSSGPPSRVSANHNRSTGSDMHAPQMEEVCSTLGCHALNECDLTS